MFDYETKRSRGFGFVTFQDSNVASNLLAMNIENKEIAPGTQQVGRMEMRGKIIEIKMAEPKEGWTQRKFRSNSGNRQHQKHHFARVYPPYYNVQMQQGSIYDPVMGMQSYNPYAAYTYMPNESHAGMAYGAVFGYLPGTIPQYTEHGGSYHVPHTTNSAMHPAAPGVVERIEPNKAMAS